MRVGVIFGQDSKCPRFTALSSVDGFGLKAQACRYFDKSCFVFASRMILLACRCLHETIGVLKVVSLLLLE